MIKGWTEAMQLMVEGDKWEMYIPSDLGKRTYGVGSAELDMAKGLQRMLIMCDGISGACSLW